MMKKIALFTLILVTMLACTTNKSNNKQAKEADTISLQPLQENEELYYEDETRRISGSWKFEADCLLIRIEAKREGVKSFTVLEGVTGFECIVGNALVLSSGTSRVRMFNVYDLNTGDELLLIDENFVGSLTPDESQSGFTFYSYFEDSPTVRWDADANKWIEKNEVPNELFNTDFDKTVEELTPNLHNWMELSALQKMHVDLKSKKVNYLNEYKWSCIEE